MEPIPSLIHKLQIQFSEGASTTQLLITVELLRNALTESRPSNENHTGVSVWLPSGFKSNPVSIAPKVETIEETEEKSSPISAPVFARAPQPPTHIIESQLIPEEILKSIKPLLAALEQSQSDNELKKVPTLLSVEPEVLINTSIPVEESVAPDHEKPMIFELLLNPEEEEITAESNNEPEELILESEQEPESEPEPEKVVIGLPSFFKKINPLQGLAVMAQPQPKPKEINQLVAVETMVLNETLATKAPILADVLVHSSDTKVADLRKVLSINEKYQFINLLFRGDDAMFERSLRTLNNFNILAEASYWMQRELVVKLGWDDDDALVQQFYKLVSRRFS